jgi:hypothetical protein
MLTPNIYLGTSGGVFPSSFRAENLYEFQNKRISATSFHYIHISLLRILIDFHCVLWRIPNEGYQIKQFYPFPYLPKKTACIKRSAKKRILNTDAIEICKI